MNSKYNHSLCDDCWAAGNPGREAFRLKEPEAKMCCCCRKRSQSGIYVRADPGTMNCGGVHGEDAPCC